MRENKPAMQIFLPQPNGEVRVFCSYENIGPCELCGVEEDRRPYGPNGEWICYDCGEKDPAGTVARAVAIIFGDQQAAKAEGGES